MFKTTLLTTTQSCGITPPAICGSTLTALFKALRAIPRPVTLHMHSQSGGGALGSDGIMDDNLLGSSLGVRLDDLRFSNVALISGFLTDVYVPPYPPDGTVILVQ